MRQNQVDYNQILQQAIALHKSGQLDLAEEKYRELLKDLPDHAGILSNLGAIQLQKNDSNAALDTINKSLALSPHQPNALNNKGSILNKLKRFDEAIESYKKAIALHTDFVNAYYNLGNVLKEVGKFEEALLNYDKAIELYPQYAEAYSNRGLVLHDLQKIDEAITSYAKAIEIDPHYANAYLNRGIALEYRGKIEEALQDYNHFISLNPHHDVVYFYKGNILRNAAQYEEAMKNYDRAIEVNPHYAMAYLCKGTTYRLMGSHLIESLKCYQKAFDLDQKIDFLQGGLLNAKMQLSIWDDFKPFLDDIIQKVEHNECVILPFYTLSLIDDLNIHLKSAQIYSQKNAPDNDCLGPINIIKKDKIKIGYFSGDFRNHPVSYLTAELYEMHDREKFEVHAFSFSPDTNDEMNLRIKAGVDYFHNVNHMVNEDIAKLSRDKQIDIAIDLTGHTWGGIEKIFAMRAAPIQINYLGYLGTMGADYYDYILADHVIIPKDKQQYYSEKIIYLPSWQINDSKKELPDESKTLSKKEYGLPEERFVFCSFNKSYKILPGLFDSWARILSNAPNSVLMLYTDDEKTQDNLKKEIEKRNVDSTRLIFGGPLSVIDYLARYRVIDLFLDSSPYNAGTTASDALRMGLPILTFPGQSYASRMGSSILTSANVTELIARDIDHYEEMAIKFATSDQEKLKEIREKIKDSLQNSDLLNTKLFTKNLEKAYEIAVNNCHHKKLDHIDVTEFNTISHKE